MPKDDKKRFLMRMPEDLHTWLTNRAKSNGRSGNQEAQQIFKEIRSKEEGKAAE